MNYLYNQYYDEYLPLYQDGGSFWDENKGKIAATGAIVATGGAAAIPMLGAGAIYDIKDKRVQGDTLASAGKGLATGATTGATIGTMVLPGIGTAIGGVIGGGIGGIVGGVSGFLKAKKKYKEEDAAAAAAKRQLERDQLLAQQEADLQAAMMREEQIRQQQQQTLYERRQDNIGNFIERDTMNPELIQAEYGGYLSQYRCGGRLKSFQEGGDIQSQLGYSDNSPYISEPQMDINTPSGQIDMNNTGMGIIANDGISEQFLPPYSGQYQFQNNIVNEKPLKNDYSNPTTPIVRMYNGQTHSGPNGGIPVDKKGNPIKMSKKQPVALVETGEVSYIGKNGRPYIFSDTLNYTR